MLISVAVLVLAIAPGAVLGLVVPAGPDRWAAWAAAPVLGLGLVCVGMAWLPWLGLPSGAIPILILELVLGITAVATARAHDRRSGVARHAQQPPAQRPPPPARATRRSLLTRWPDVVAVSVAAALCLVVAELMLGGHRYPPGWDAQNHGLLTRNILVLGTTKITTVCVDGTTVPATTCHFYPLAMDVWWAQSAAFTHGMVSTSILTSAIVIGPLSLVVALYAAVRAMAASPVVAGAVALAPAVVGPLWVAMMGGRVPEEAGPGLGIAVGVLTLCAVRGRHPVRMGLLAGLGMAGLLATHTYDVLFAATVAAALILSVRGRTAWRRIGLVVGTAALVGLAIVAPFGSSLLGASGERQTTPPNALGHFQRALRFWLWDPRRYSAFGFPAPGDHATLPDLTLVHLGLWLTVACLLASPLCFVTGRVRWARPWVGLWALWTAVGIWTSYSDSAPATLLSGLWYGGPERLRVMILPVYGTMVVAGACVIGLGLQWVASSVGTRVRAGRPPRWVAPGVVAAVVAALYVIAIAVHAEPELPLRRDLADRTAVGPSYPRVFRWLHDHTLPGQVVAADRNVESMVWVYADYGTGLLFGIPPLIAASKRNAHARDVAWDWLVGNPGAVPAGCEVREFGVAFVVVGDQRVTGYPTKYDRTRLSATPNLKLVHQDGGIKVFAITSAGRACPTS